jgi:SAM-dependent methyltransferase
MSAEFDRYAREYAKLRQDSVLDRFASDSQFYYEVKWDLVRDFYLRSGQAMSECRWLDVGCGGGDLLRLGGHDCKEAVGCDPSREQLARCGDLNVSLQPGPDRLPFAEQSFDLVTAACVYHHVPPGERSRLTEQVFRVLRPGGILCIIEHNPFNPVAQWIVHNCPLDVGAQLITPRGLRRLLCDAAFQIAETDYFLYFPKSLHRRLANFERRLRRIPLGGQYAVFAQR